MIKWDVPWDARCDKALRKAEKELASQGINLNKKIKNWNGQYITAFSEDFLLREKRAELEILKSKGWGIWLLDRVAERKVSMVKEFEIV